MAQESPEDFEEKAGALRDLEKWMNGVGGSSLQHPHPLIQIMSAKGQPVIRDAQEVLRQAELLLMRKELHQASIGQLLGGTMLFLDEFVREYEGAIITSDFVRRAKELRGRFRLEFRVHKV